MATKFKQYTRTNIAEMRPYNKGTKLSERVSVSASDTENGSPKEGDMIARNPKDHKDQWLVAKEYFEDNFEESKVLELTESTPKGRVEAELAQAEHRQDNLNQFLESGPKLSAEAIKLLRKQSLVMTNYINILKKRIEIWND